ncbi:hypothetical protein ACFU5P_13085 [Streptomyces sp. NPDC057433]|uniref:hypothetical protein n=1 Tax=Streptomyces sp. NPDC057433 TaxID=3346132 RepID=UPI003694E97A
MFALPKGADLHVHLSGCGRGEDWVRCGEAVGMPGTRAERLEIRRPGPATAFFDEIVPTLTPWRKHPEVILSVLELYLHRALRENVGYAEILTGPFGYRTADAAVPVDYMVRRYRQILRRAQWGVRVHLLVNVARNAADVEDRLRRSAEFAARHDDLWRGVQLSGVEEGDADLVRLRDVYDGLALRFPKLGWAVHAGESSSAPNAVRTALSLPVTRIGHALGGAAYAEALRRGRVTVESSPISNVMLGYVRSWEEHPLPSLLRSGVPVCLCTDNPGVWGAQLTDEFFVAVQFLHVTWSEVVEMTVRSIEAAFCVPEEKRVRLAAHVTAIERFVMVMEQWVVGAAEPPVPVVSPFALRHLAVPQG